MKSKGNSLRNSKPKQKRRSRHLNKKSKHRVSLRGGVSLTDTEKLALLEMRAADLEGAAGSTARVARAAGTAVDESVAAEAAAANAAEVARNALRTAVEAARNGMRTAVAAAAVAIAPVAPAENTEYTFENAINDFRQNAIAGRENTIYRTYLEPNTRDSRVERARAQALVEPILNRNDVSIEARKLLALRELRRLANDYYNVHRPIGYLPAIVWD